MSVTFFASGLTVSDDAAARADAFCESATLARYMDEHNGSPPDGWPSNQARKELIEWTIKSLFAGRVRAWEHDQLVSQVATTPWDGPAK